MKRQFGLDDDYLEDLKDAILFAHPVVDEAEIGTPGGDVQPQAMIQVLLNLVRFGMSPQEAVEQPRFAGWTFPDTHWPHPYTPGRLNVDDRVPATQLQKLTARGYEVVPWNYLDYRAGSVCIALRVEDKGLLAAAADPRGVSYAIGY